MTITLSGREIFPSDGNPIIGADVYAYRSDTDALVDQTTTDANGDWSMSVDSLAAGYNTKVVYGQGIRWGYIAQKIQGQSVIIDGSITVRDWANSADATKIDGGDIYVGSLIEIASSGSIRSGQTAYNTGTGWWLGDVAGTPKLSIGNPAANSMTWDGTTLAITGTITATAGTIGGWTIAATYLTSAGLTIDSSGFIAVGATDILTGDGVFMNITPARFRAGTISGGALLKGIYFDGTNLAWTGVNTSLTAAGAFTATSATITGTITATAGAIGGFTLSASSISVGADATTIAMDVNFGIWCGATLFAASPFRVTRAGALIATDATLTGSLTMATSSTFFSDTGLLLWKSGSTVYGKAITRLVGSNPSIYLGAVGGATATMLAACIAYVDANNYMSSSVTFDGSVSPKQGTFSLQANHAASVMTPLDLIVPATGNHTLKITALLYPGTGTNQQSTRYISDDGTQTYISAGLKVAGLAGVGTRAVVVDANGVMSAP